MIPIERRWQAADTTVEVEIPVDRIGVASGSDLVFAIQVRDRSDVILESVPPGRQWIIAIPGPGSTPTDWQA